jgi:hypothetical protein
MSALFDIKAVRDQAAKEIADERVKKAKDALVKQMRVVAAAQAVVRAEEMKQADLEQQIADGTF